MPKIRDEILAILAAAKTEGNMLYLQGQLERADYTATNKVLEAAGGKWNRAQKAHVFDEDAAGAIEQALTTGEFRRIKQELGQFDTPDDIVAMMIARADIRLGNKVLEPSAGIGAICRGIIAAGGSLRWNELDPKRYAALWKLFPHGRNEDFLKIDGPRAWFDRVVMNPPFAKQADIDHVRHALRFLKPGGRLVSVMSPGITFRQDRKTRGFLDYLAENVGYTIEPLPDNAFAKSGTAVRTILLTVDV